MSAEDAKSRHPSSLRRSPPGPPVELTVYWCPACGSLFLHQIGSWHIKQSGLTGSCVADLVELQFYR